jgi:hypothetical protein
LKLISSLSPLSQMLTTSRFTSEWDLKSNCSNMLIEPSKHMSSPINKIKNSWRLSSICRKLYYQYSISMVSKITWPSCSKRSLIHPSRTISSLTQPIHFWTCASCTSSCSCWLKGSSVWVISAELFRTKLKEWSSSTLSR